jgi:hypothetical protein
LRTLTTSEASERGGGWFALGARRGRTSRSALKCTAAAEYTTGVKRNLNLGKLQAGYLFPEVPPSSRRFGFGSLSPVRTRSLANCYTRTTVRC